MSAFKSQVKMPSVSATMKQFFDRDAVMSAVGTAQRRAMAQSGNYVMKAARNSIRNASKKSPVSAADGKSPPKSQTGLLKEHIYFAYDASTGGIVVGPSKLNAKGRDVPKVLEYGGDTEIYEPAGQFVTGASGKTEKLEKGRNKKITMAARPFMQPALTRSADKLKKIWAGSVKRGRA